MGGDYTIRQFLRTSDVDRIHSWYFERVADIGATSDEDFAAIVEEKAAGRKRQ